MPPHNALYHPKFSSPRQLTKALLNADASAAIDVMSAAASRQLDEVAIDVANEVVPAWSSPGRRNRGQDVVACYTLCATTFYTYIKCLYYGANKKKIVFLIVN